MVSAGFDGTVTEADYSRSWNIGAQDGVDSTAAWAVTQGTGRQVSVAAQSGYALAKAVVSRASAALTASLGTPTNGQWYLIVRRIDWVANNGETIAALPADTTGTVLPTAPPATYANVSGMQTTPGASYDHPLAWAWVRSTDTSMVLFDLRRLPGQPADLDALLTWGGPEGHEVTVLEGGARFVRRGGRYRQITPASFVDVATRQTAYAKASAGYVAPGVEAWDLTNRILYRFDGSSWKPWSSDWMTFNTTPVAEVNPGSFAASAVITWKYADGQMVWSATITITTVGTSPAPTGAILMPLPVVPAAISMGVGRAVNGNQVQARQENDGSNNGRAVLFIYNNNSAISATGTMFASGSYRP